MEKKYVDKDLEIEKAVKNAIASMEMEGFKVTEEERLKLIKKYKEKIKK